MIGRILVCLLIIGLWMNADAQNFNLRSTVIQQPGDADYTVPVTTTEVWTSVALTATRTFTLPSASAVGKGSTIRVTDLVGAISTPGYNIILDGNGSDTVNGRTTFTISCQYGSVVVQSNGSNGWAVASKSCDIPNAANLIPITPTGAVQGPLKLMKLSVAPIDPPGAGFAQLYIGKGTTQNTCQLWIVAGNSTTATSIKDNVGAGC